MSREFRSIIKKQYQEEMQSMKQEQELIQTAEQNQIDQDSSDEEDVRFLDLSSKMDELNWEISICYQHMERSENKYNELLEQYNFLKENNKEMKEAIQMLRREKYKLKTENNLLKNTSKIDELNWEISICYQHMERSENKYNQLLEQYKFLKENNKEMKEAIQMLKREKYKLKTENNLLKNT
jgi:uncharacterized coiled-coil DUF342 family protein